MQLIDYLNDENIEILKGVTSDSRQVKSGYLFAALPGSKLKGDKFIADAIQNGATVIVVETGALKDLKLSDDVSVIEDENPRKAFSKIVAQYYKLQPQNIVAVTGTSGKTSTVSFVQQLWHLSGIEKCASLGTLGIRGPGIRRGGSLTTPDTQSLHAEITDLASVGINHLAMEASSHGLDQFRLDGVNVKAAAFANLSRDHMDYHSDMDDYFEAKARLFSEVMKEKGVAIINADDEYGQKLIPIAEKRNHKIVTFGQAGETIKLLKRDTKPNGQDITIAYNDKNYDVMLPLVGEFQVMNALCALGLVLSQDDDAEKYIPLLEKLRGVPGRLQFVSGHEKGAVYVDYAHKPAALEMILKTLRPHTKNKLVCVFGCGGNRDKGKRAMMGKIATDLSDVTIVTDDNPRDENAASIRAQIMETATGALEVADRSKAINQAVQDLEEGDILVVAGKGHEQGQIIGDEVHPFDDVEEVKKSIDKLSN